MLDHSFKCSPPIDISLLRGAHLPRNAALNLGDLRTFGSDL